MCGSPYALEHPILQDAEQLGLEGGFEIPNLVEEDRPLFGELEAAGVTATRPNNIEYANLFARRRKEGIVSLTCIFKKKSGA